MRKKKREEFNRSQSNLLSQNMVRVVANIIVLKLTFIILYLCYFAYKFWWYKLVRVRCSLWLAFSKPVGDTSTVFVQSPQFCWLLLCNVAVRLASESRKVLGYFPKVFRKRYARSPTESKKPNSVRLWKEVEPLYSNVKLRKSQENSRAGFANI